MHGDIAVDYSTVTRRIKPINDGQEEPEPFRNWSKMQSIEFYNEGICALAERWEKAVRKAVDYIEK